MYSEMVMIGIILSLAYSEISGINPGGIIVPAYFAINLAYPERAAYTFISAVLTAFLVRKIFSKCVVYGRRTYVLCIALSFCLHFVLQLCGADVPGYISYLVPGILAREFDRQGIAITSVSLIIVTGVTVLVLTLLGFNII